MTTPDLAESTPMPLPLGDVLPVETERLTLRAYQDSDLDMLAEMFGSAQTVRYLYEPVLTRDQLDNKLALKIAATGLASDGDSVTAVVVDRASGAPVGEALLILRSAQHRQGEVGYVLLPGREGNGYAAEAASALLALGFATYGLHRIIARADARNTASLAVMQRLGMRYEAHLVQNEWVKGEWTDEVAYAMLADEFVPTA